MNIKKIFAVIAAAVIFAASAALGISAAKKGIFLSKSAAVLSEGETLMLKYYIKDVKADTVVWSSNNQKAVSVSQSGKVTARSAGRAVITVKIKGTSYKARCTVTVKTPVSYNLKDKSKITLEGKTYDLTFEDEFSGTELDTAKWNRCPQWKRQDLNNYWDDSMTWLDGKGNLIVGMTYDSKKDRYLSGGVETKGLFEQAYGYFEIRCTVNTVPGYWTAFWLMGDCVMDETQGGVNGTEIDIMETPYYSRKQVQNTLNWDGYGAAHKAEGKVSDINIYDGEYHIFSLLWKEDEYVFYVDGTETWRTKAEKAQGICREPLYMIISSEMGSWTGKPDPKNLPDQMKVDYVRVYA